MAEWLYEDGIGEARAALVEDGRILEALIEPDDAGARAGAVCEARLREILPGGRAGRVELGGGEEALVEPLPRGATEGAALLVEIVRSAIPEPGRPKLARAKAGEPDTEARDAPSLLDRIALTGVPVVRLASHAPDRLEAAGWSELLEQAETGAVAFPGGALRIALTPAMTVIDVDGALPPAELAIAGAAAAGAAVRRLGIAGSIGIDLPTSPDKAARQAAAEAFDAALPHPFERTAVNGFGFLQAVRRRERPSLLERAQYEPVAWTARALLRRAERTPGSGERTLAAHPSVADLVAAHAGWLAALERRLGTPVHVRADPALALGGGHVAAVHPG